MLLFNNVCSQPTSKQKSYPRFVAILDILGMKQWLNQSNPEEIATQVEYALSACDHVARGSYNNQPFGPLVQFTHFSDTVFAWTPDDSWTSFSVITDALNMVMGIALKNGIPMRGSISIGEAVCNSDRLRFVGNPISDAYKWSEIDEARKYKSAGIDFTPITIETLSNKLKTTSIEKDLNNDRHGKISDVLTKKIEMNSKLIWHKNQLFINHWSHGMFLRCEPNVLFHKRGLPSNTEVEKKCAQLIEFYQHYVCSNRDTEISLCHPKSLHHLYFALDKVRKERIPF
ncbi:hypothetical protein PWG14_28820 [Chromobacterium amazonense]|uniref:hypothetical protein n=1 Tax=Chromobacterium amazonense TaxID=1382803 RepID=UPI00237DCE4D|nr:hypothetical protein [Chromobacterium amazonense]MDE1716473.1 hypothetical protein [Chromobacterium amazonense]